jgi:hypothetical protein
MVDAHVAEITRPVALPSIRADIDPEVAALWSLSRDAVERVYANAFARNDRKSIRWLAYNDRYFLLTCLLRRADARIAWAFERCREVEADPDDKLDLWAREHYKSTIITFAGIIQEILKNPDVTVGIFAHNRPISKAFLRQIKEELEANDLLKSLFPDCLWERPEKEAPKWSEDDGIVVRRTTNPKEATVEAWGLVDGMPTSKHFLLRVYDDVVTEKSVTSPEMIKKTTAMFELSDNLGARGGRSWFVGTRYHFADTYGVMIERGTVEERRHPATHDGSFDGRPLFWTEQEWELKKSRQSKPILAAQQLLNPLAGSESRFDLKWLNFWEIRPKRLNIYILCDPSKGRHATSDRTAFAVIGVDINRNKYLLDAICHRMSLSKRWTTLLNMQKRWAKMPGSCIVLVGYEQFGMQTDIEYFEERMQREQYSFPIEEVKWPRQGPKSKQQRIERLEPDFRMARFRLPNVIRFDDEGRSIKIDPTKNKAAQAAIAHHERWRVPTELLRVDEDGKVYNVILRFLEEYMFFPFAPHDDLLDAMSRIYDMDPTPPVMYDNEPGRPNSTEPELFADGV